MNAAIKIPREFLFLVRNPLGILAFGDNITVNRVSPVSVFSYLL